MTDRQKDVPYPAAFADALKYDVARRDGERMRQRETLSYAEKRALLIAYLTMKLEENDIHAVCDAGMDLRELDAEERGRMLGKQDTR